MTRRKKKGKPVQEPTVQVDKSSDEARQPRGIHPVINFAVLIVALAIGLLLAEGIARQFLPEKPPPEKSRNIFSCEPVPGSDMVYRVKPNAAFTTFGASYQTNEFGFRDGPVSEKTDSMFRIVCVGDSVTFGTGVSIPETFPNALESLLEEKSPGEIQFDVVNAGVSAYNASNIRGLLETHITDLEPDAVVYTFVENDLDDSFSMGPNEYLMPYDPSKPPDAPFIIDDFAPTWVMRKQSQKESTSALGQLFRAWFHSVPDTNPPLLIGDHPETRRRWESFKRDLARMKEICVANDATLLMYIFGLKNHSEPVNERVISVCKDLDIPVASTLPIFTDRDYMKRYSLGFDPHCNPLGNRLMAERLFCFLLEEGVLPGDFDTAVMDGCKYEEEMDEKVLARLKADALDAPEEIDLERLVGIGGVVGGIDMEGRMARTCILRVGGIGNILSVEVSAPFATQGQVQSLAAAIEGATPTAVIEVTSERMTCPFPIPDEYRDKPIEVELRAIGPVWIPPPDKRQQGAAPCTLKLWRISRENRTS